MSDLYRIGLANIRHADSAEESVALTLDAIARAAVCGARIVCFPESYVPGYKRMGGCDEAFLDEALARVRAAARTAGIAVVLGTERVTVDARYISAAVVDADGALLGYQDKVQLDPSEDAGHAAGAGRSVFTAGPLTFGVAICHEGWRYPETVRWAVRRGAQLVFHPHFAEAEPGGYRPTTFADPANTFHEKAVLCRAAENTCYFASVNCACEGSSTTSAVADPNGAVVCWQPYGASGILTADLDLEVATGLLARRCR